MQPTVKAIQLSKRYGQKAALEDFSCTIEPGQIVGVIGPNGAGKSTFLQCISGMHRYSGKLDVLGRCPKVHRKQILKQASFLPDPSAMPQWMSIAQLVRVFQAGYPYFSTDPVERRIRELGISTKGRIKHLSKGMRAQLYLALIIGTDVPLAVLDEPTLGLDIRARDQFYQTLAKEFINPIRSIILASHQVQEIQEVLTHVLLINKGRCILHAPVKKLLESFCTLEMDKDDEALTGMDASNAVGRTDGISSAQFLFEREDAEQLPQWPNCKPASLQDICKILL